MSTCASATWRWRSSTSRLGYGCADNGVPTSLEAVQLHRGLGYLTETELEREVRDAWGRRIFSGTSELQRELVARSMGL